MKTDGVPADFPLGISAVVPGAQPKLCVVRRAGRYLDDQACTSRRERWLVCEDLACQLVTIAMKDVREVPDTARAKTLQRIKLAIAHKRWLSNPELEWLINRLRELLAW